MATEINVRALALETLTEIDRGTKNASEAIQTTLRTYQYLDKKDRSFYTRICQGTLEYRIQIDYFINQVSKTPVHKCKPFIRNLLRMSLYQIRFMDRVADEAVCDEAVKLAKKKGFQNLSGFVNGVLRNLVRQKEQLKLPERPAMKEKREAWVSYLSIQYSLPEWIVCRLMEWYGLEIAENVAKAFLKEAPLSVRINTRKATKESVREELEQANICVEDGVYCDNVLQLSEYNYLNRIVAFREGRITVQDESSCLQGYLIPSKNEVTNADISTSSEAKDALGIRVLDICAAPGGKSMHAAERISGSILARDLTEAKVERIQENIDRMGYSNIHTEVHDALELDEDLIGQIDILIADVPCSGLGVIGRKHDIKYRMGEQQLEELVELQRAIMKVAAKYLKRNGLLIYSTCTIHPAENEMQVTWLQEELEYESVSIRECLPEKLVEEIKNQPGTDLEHGYCTLIPGLQQCDGFFMACLRKK